MAAFSLIIAVALLPEIVGVAPDAGSMVSVFVEFAPALALIVMGKVSAEVG